MFKRDYPESAYDEYLCIKPTLLMWVIIAFIFRPFIVLIASVVNKADRVGILNAFYPDRSAAFFGVVASVPVIFLFIAWFKKQPGASTITQRIWHHGRALLVSSLLLNLFILLWHEFIRSPSLQNMSGSTMVQLVFCLLSIYYLFRSRQLADAFSNFPK